MRAAEVAAASAAKEAEAAAEGAAAMVAAAAAMDQEAVEDELLLQRLLWAWRRYASWLDHVSACFAHHQGTSCRAHLACLLAEIRGAEYGTSQHTPSLVHAGYATLRAVRVPNPHPNPNPDPNPNPNSNPNPITLTLTLALTRYATFRAAVVLRRDATGVPRILLALKRHLRRASASVLSGGGFSTESG